MYWAQYELVHPYRTQVHVSGTAVSRSGLVTHEWGVLNSVSTAFSHREGITVTRVAVQSQRPGSTHREVTYLQLGSPAICVCVCTVYCAKLYFITTTTTAAAVAATTRISITTTTNFIFY